MASNPEVITRRQERLQLMQALYKRVGVNQIERVTLSWLANDIAMDKEVSQHHAQYLQHQGLIKIEMNWQCRITNYGIEEVEQSLMAPTEPTEHFSPISINIGSMMNSAISTGSNSPISQTFSVTDSQRGEVKAALDEILRELNGLSLEPDDLEELRADLETLKHQASSPKPKATIISTAMTSAKGMVEKAGASAVQALVVTGLNKIGEIFQSL